MPHKRLSLVEVTENVDAEESYTEEQQFDPLLECLEAVAHHYDRTVPRAALLAGLPLADGLLTPRLAVRAAPRADLVARIVKRPLSKLTNLLVPVILVLNDNGAAVLLENRRRKAKVLLPDAGGGVENVRIKDLAKDYSGYAILIKPAHKIEDDRPEQTEVRSRNWFWGTVRHLWPTYTQVLVAAALVNLLGLAAPLFIMNIYDRVLPNKALTTLWVLAIGMVAAIVFDFVFRSLRNSLIGNAGRRADVILAGHIFQHVLRLDGAFKPDDTGGFANKLRDYEIVREFFTSNTIVTFTDFVFVGLYIFVIYQIAGPVALVPLAALALVLVFGLLLQWPLKRTVAHSQSEASQRHSVLFETLAGLETIKCARAEGQMQRRWELFVGQNSWTAHRLRTLSSLGLNFTVFVQQLVTVGVVVVGVHLFDQGDISPGALIAAVILAGRGVAPLGQIAATLARAQQAFHALRALNQIMAQPEETDLQPRHIDKAIDSGEVGFDAVTFAYPNTQIPVLKDFSLQIKSGERVGIIGRIGSGKTTIGRLLARLYVPSSGALLIDGVEIRQYHPAEVRRQIAFIAQDSALFTGSVRDNIALGMPHIPDDVVIRAAELAGVSEFVKSNPMGYDMPVGEGGRLLSSGQKQAIVLARAFLSDPAVIFLDEPTGSMDMASENLFIKRMQASLNARQTLIVTTHRSRALNLVDRLIVIERGRIVADGPKDRILQKLAKNKPAE